MRVQLFLRLRYLSFVLLESTVGATSFFRLLVSCQVDVMSVCRAFLKLSAGVLEFFWGAPGQLASTRAQGCGLGGGTRFARYFWDFLKE